MPIGYMGTYMFNHSYVARFVRFVSHASVFCVIFKIKFCRFYRFVTMYTNQYVYAVDRAFYLNADWLFYAVHRFCYPSRSQTVYTVTVCLHFCVSVSMIKLERLHRRSH